MVRCVTTTGAMDTKEKGSDDKKQNTGTHMANNLRRFMEKNLSFETKMVKNKDRTSQMAMVRYTGADIMVYGEED